MTMRTSAKAKSGKEFAAAGGATNNAREAWRVFGIMSEFVEATDRLSGVQPAVTIFGSARIAVDSPAAIFFNVGTDRVVRVLYFWTY